jgi:hypothetical protein
MADIKVDLEALCTCGDELIIKPTNHAGQFVVTPCDRCLLDKFNEGYDVGHKEASE